MSYQNVSEIVRKYLITVASKSWNKTFARDEDITFENGYTLFVFDEPYYVKLYFYPENDRLRITTIPTDRKYNITSDMNIEIPGFGYFFLKHQPQKSNSELMIQIPTTHLTMTNIDDAVKAIVPNTRKIFMEFEK